MRHLSETPEIEGGTGRTGWIRRALPLFGKKPRAVSKSPDVSRAEVCRILNDIRGREVKLRALRDESADAALASETARLRAALYS